MTGNFDPTARDLLLIVDVQLDFCPGGALAVADGDAVVPVINRLAGRFETVVLTQDWHPVGHSSFASRHPGRNPFDMTEMPYGPQVLWPDHCVQGSAGAGFHPDLDTDRAQLVVRKGIRPGIDSYSALYENDRVTPTGLLGWMQERKIHRVVCAGLAYDFCVRYSAEDCARQGFETLVVGDACRAVAMPGTVEAAEESFRALGIPVVESATLLG